MTTTKKKKGDLDLQQRYGISVGAIRRYAKQLRAAGSLPADGSIGINNTANGNIAFSLGVIAYPSGEDGMERFKLQAKKGVIIMSSNGAR